LKDIKPVIKIITAIMMAKKRLLLSLPITYATTHRADPPHNNKEKGVMNSLMSKIAQ